MLDAQSCDIHSGPVTAVGQLKPVVAICEISLSGLSNQLNRLVIPRGTSLSSLLRDRRRRAQLHHSLAGVRKISLQKLADEDWVLLRRSSAPELVDALTLPWAKAGFSPRVINEPDSLETVLTMVAAGIGVSLVPSCVRSLKQSDERSRLDAGVRTI
jgi:DNA-binding transcriptional LysR family regulator